MADAGGVFPSDTTAAVRGTWVFDVCGTLYDENTTAGFIAHYHRARGNSVREAIVGLVVTRRSPVRAALIIAGRLIGRDVARGILVLTLRGERRNDLTAAARDYVDGLREKAIAPAHRLLAEACQAGETIILGSNSLDIVVAEIARRFGVTTVASQLGFDGDRARGTLATNTRGRKLAAIEMILGEPARPLRVVTNNASDRDLLAAADQRVLVADGRVRRWMAEWNADIIRH